MNAVLECLWRALKLPCTLGWDLLKTLVVWLVVLGVFFTIVYFVVRDHFNQ